MINIIQQLEICDKTYIFTENPEIDIVEIQRQYEDENRDYYMGYEIPIIEDFEFLGNKYKAITFWHDNEDIRPIIIN
jgi:hypothetical protein